MTVNIITGDSREVLPLLDDQSAQMCVTSPPYFGLRDYGVDGQIGLEGKVSEYVAALVSVFREVRRVLADDGTLWLNLGDSYAGSWGAQSREHAGKHAPNISALSANQVKAAQNRHGTGSLTRTPGLKNKDLIGIPWRVAFALQDDGWYLRSDIVWHKPNPMPESVTDRPTRAHEFIFLLTKSERYYYDRLAICEPLKASSLSRLAQGVEQQAGSTRANGGVRADRPMRAVRFGGNKGQGEYGSAARPASGRAYEPSEVGANKRDVWTIATRAYRGAHFATFPPALVEPCILAGSRPNDVVLDPFGGAGTTGVVAQQYGRSAILIELNPEYAALAKARVEQAANETPV